MAIEKVMLAVDLSFQIYRAAASHQGLYDSSGTYTGGLYGFMQSFAKAVRETGAMRCVVCRDSKPYRRSADYPKYKQLRADRKDSGLGELYTATEPLVLDLLAVAGVPVWSVPGFESDDLIAAIVRDGIGCGRIYAASNDSDLYQLLDDPGFRIYRDGIGNTVSRDSLMQSHGLTPAQFALAAALTGTHNDIEGIPGVGPKRARDAVLDPAKMRKLREQHAEVIDRNAALIRLPHQDFPPRSRPPSPGPRMTSQAFYRWCARYEIDATLSMVDAFDQINPIFPR
jgi:5'-3' exonuclease